MKYGVSLDDLIRYSDPVKQHNELMQLASPRFMEANGQKASLKYLMVRNGTGLASVNRAINQSVIHRTSLSIEAYLSRCLDAPIIIDTGASTSLTAFKEDFAGPIVPVEQEDIKGLTGKAKALGQGMVEYKVQDMHGNVQVLRTLAVWVPDANI